MKTNFKKSYFLILLLIFILFLSGCSGLYNLGNFVLPDNEGFFACIQELDTPEKIGNYMLENFTYEAHLYYSPDPYSLWVIKKGDCNDFSTFALFVANYHSYNTFLINIKYKNYKYDHYLAIYEENSLYNFSSNQYYYPVNYNNFIDIVRFNSQIMFNGYGHIWSKYVVYDYWNNIVEEVTSP